MSLVDLRPFIIERQAVIPLPSARQPVPPLQCELEGLFLDPLSPAERGDVREILDLVATRLCQKAETMASARRRLEAIVSDLIGAMDLLDGDCDLEPYFAGQPSPVAPDEAEPDNDAETCTATETHGCGFHWTPLTSLDDDEDGNDDEPLEAADA